MICELKNVGSSNPLIPTEVILRKPTLADRLAILFLRKNREIVFTQPVQVDALDGKED